jgi:hypothetical protein
MAKIIITEKQMDLMVTQLLSEAVGVPKNIIESASELYEIVLSQIKNLDRHDTKQEFYEEDLNLSISDYIIDELDLTVTIDEIDGYDGPVVMASAGVSNDFTFDRNVLMKVNYKDNSIDLYLNFISPESGWEPQEVYQLFIEDRVNLISILAHEMKHKFDKQKKLADLIGNDADYQTYSSSGLEFGIPIINEFMRYSYFIQGVENLVRPTEMATRMKLNGVTRDKFRDFFENDTVIVELKQIRNFSYDYLIEKLKEQMDRVDGLLSHANVPYETMNEDEKIEVVMDIVYVNLLSAKKDNFDRMTSDGNEMRRSLMRILGRGNDDQDEGFDSVRNKFLNHISKYQNNVHKFFVDECERFNYEATKLIKKISKIYSLIPGDDEQTNESIINWELHQKLMEKRYGKRKIETDFKFKRK